MKEATKEEIRASVRERYARTARSGGGAVESLPAASCCASVGTTLEQRDGGLNQADFCCGSSVTTLEQLSETLGYSPEDISGVPEGANMGLGCGNPLALAGLKPGETVLDLGSGGGFDCFLAAREVGPTGRVIGVDMTPDMVSLARKNKEKAGAVNVEFRLGEIEHLPVADASVDIIMSNCVINLSPDKLNVYREAYRVLRPGGRLAVSDVLATAELPEHIRNDLALIGACIGGAETVDNTEKSLKTAGFQDIRIIPQDISRELIRQWAPGKSAEEYVVSAYIEAFKPI